MALRDIIQGLVVGLLIERPASRRTFDELSSQLESSKAKLNERLANVNDTSANRTLLRHIIGIERWGQRRLRVALGETPVLDEYDDYQPSADLSWADLRNALSTTRQETVTLARQLGASSVDSSLKVRHNDFGPLSLRGWLRYLNTHANIESQRFKKG